MYIALEGPEGSGKGTQILLLKDHLEKLGYSVVLVREPGSTLAGDAIRDILLNPTRNLGLLGITEAFLFSASRAQLVREVIRPALKENKIVLSDRTFASTYAYQGFGRKFSIWLLKVLTYLAVGKTRPDVFLLLDLDVKIGLARRRQTTVNRLDLEELPFHERVRVGYLKMARYRRKWIRVNADQSVSRVHKEILAKILPKLPKLKK